MKEEKTFEHGGGREGKEKENIGKWWKKREKQKERKRRKGRERQKKNQREEVKIKRE